MHAESEGWIYVWDPFVRVFHWALVATFAVAYLTGDEVLGIHVWTGYAIGVLIVTRLMTLTFVWQAGSAAAVVAAALLVTVGLGLAGTLLALNQKPATVLRNL